eukprot:2946879-Rhodomonas_salina.1
MVLGSGRWVCCYGCGMRCAVRRQAIVLWVCCYAVCGTDVAYGGRERAMRETITMDSMAYGMGMSCLQ